ncbi:Short transmembrane mitochondrial protein 1 [Dioscorea alata]|uniref:Short transmembrane mitochondrial protein 1 n=1 Tax=Dioscorea alata TaxID=55571 RepID=A0ACB7V3N5_DIOAL|nr:Short transmembrane mitochondrial protein 1 [Dioscorea alata]
MGLIRSSFSFLLGTGCGIYIAQNYNVPNIKKLVDTYLQKAKEIEQINRKPKKDDD